jgi:NAD+ kinase
MNSAIIFVKHNDGKAKAIADAIILFLGSNGVKASLDNFKADLAIVVGGDGTFLGAVRTLNEFYAEKESLPPVLGINTGSLGFLAESSISGWEAVLKRGLESGFNIEERSMLDVCIEDKHYIVLNDVVVNRNSVARMIDFDVHYNGEFVANTKADGVIVSTPTGSTAYSLAAGGPIMHPSIPAFVITPVSPHTLTNRPIVVADTGEIRITVKTDVEEILVTLDGQKGVCCNSDNKVIIKRAKRMLKLIRPQNVTYFDILKNKLSFGKRG